MVQTQEMIAGGRFCSGDDAMRVFAAGAARQLEIEINWRSGKQSIITNARPNCIYEMRRAAPGRGVRRCLICRSHFSRMSAQN